jgi:SAM-dependent methyltransferase
LVSPPEDYEAEAQDWRDALRSKLGPGHHDILDLGVGGGHHLSHLTRDFRATAVDVSECMLQFSAKLNPGVEHHLGDMRTVRLGRKFWAVIIHDAIDYMLTEADLRAAFATAKVHLEPGGVFITAPDHFRETYRDARVNSTTRSDGKTELTFIQFDHDPDPEDTTVETIMFYLIRECGRLRIEHDRHVTGLFPLQTWLRLLKETGFSVEQVPCKRGDDPQQSLLLVGTLGDRTEQSLAADAEGRRG